MWSEIREFFTTDSLGEFAWKTIAVLLLPFMWLNILAVIVAMGISVFAWWLIAIPKSVIEVIREKKRDDENPSSEPEDPWFVNYKTPSLP